MAVVHLVLLVVALLSASEPEGVAMVFFRHLAEGEGADAASMCSEEAFSNVTPMLQRLKERIESDDPGFLQSLRRCGYSADPEEMLDWSEEEYLARTLSLPMVSARYSRYDTAWVCSTSFTDSRGEVYLCLEAGTAPVLRAPVAVTRERGGWRVVDFMGMYSFP
ncbi:MAG: hypothetical protein R6U36_06265 [Candidatus Fermentibacteraceae bacterium]